MGFRLGEVLSGRCKPGDIASGAARGNCLRETLLSAGDCARGRALPFEKPIEHSAVALVESENAPGDEISHQVKRGGREFDPRPMKRQAEEQSEWERSESGDPGFDQRSP